MTQPTAAPSLSAFAKDTRPKCPACSVFLQPPTLSPDPVLQRLRMTVCGKCFHVFIYAREGPRNMTLAEQAVIHAHPRNAELRAIHADGSKAVYG